jgi:hypothetical protein
MKFENKDQAAHIITAIEKQQRLLKEIDELDGHDVIIQHPSGRKILVVQTYLSSEEYKVYAQSFIEAVKAKLRKDIKELNTQLAYL